MVVEAVWNMCLDLVHFWMVLEHASQIVIGRSGNGAFLRWYSLWIVSRESIMPPRMLRFFAANIAIGNVALPIIILSSFAATVQENACWSFCDVV